ncbi:MAG: aminotransferase class III-fold pyridoxal phosphate-dependent enzyme [Polyangiales bacterium]
MLDLPLTLIVAGTLGVLAVVWFGLRVSTRLLLSRAKHPSLRGHARISRWIARHVPAFTHADGFYFRSDGAPDVIEQRRRAAFTRLTELFQARHPKTLQLTARAAPSLSDLQFTGAYRVPPPYSQKVREQLKTGVFVERSYGVKVVDVDGHEFYDLAGSYGVNVFGYDFYKGCLEEAYSRVSELGPVLGSYHPLVAQNAERIRQISGHEEVSFHMSGTEAVMQAVRLARYHTRRTHLVRFCGAYHGFWGDVQPGVGNPVAARETYTLKDMDETTLRVLRTRSDIACVLVNPLQALHPNQNAPSDSGLLDSTRSAGFDRAAYTAWLKQLRQVCTERGIALIFDEVFVGFRLALGGAQAYFGVRADLVTYGKTLGGGLPVGVVCGSQSWMKRFDDTRPADICLARGTFNSHPHVMAAMHAFLERLQTPSVQALYAELDQRWDARAARFNAQLKAAGVPVEVHHLSSIWTVCYTQPSRYNWMLQYYLRAEGLALSWVGTGRLIWSLNYTDEDFEAVCQRFVAAARNMQDDGFFWADPALTNKAIKRRVLRELIASFRPAPREQDPSAHPAVPQAAPRGRA